MAPWVDGEGPVRSVQAACGPQLCLWPVFASVLSGRGGPVLHVSGSVPVRLVSAVAPAQGDSAGARAQTAAVACADVFFLGARGSGELPTKPFHGLGPEVDAMASAVQNVLKADGVTAQGSFRTLNVGYPADSASDLAPTRDELALFAASLAAGGQHYYTHNVEKFLSSISEGISDTISEAKYVHQQCPHALLILAGYSQGAMVMHQVELQLQAAGDNGLLGQIAGTLLLGDGDRVPNTQAREFGTSSAKSEGVRTWVHSLIGIGGQDVADPATTANICNAGDIVCATSLRVLKNASAGIAVHTSYVHGTHVDPALTSAADWVGQLAAGRVLGSHWKAAFAPVPPDAAADPDVHTFSVSCYSASWCAAVGSYANSSGGSPGLLLTKSGSAWSAAEALLPPGSGTASVDLYYSVACPSASSCVAVGDYSPSSGSGGSAGGLIETWSGKGWSAATAPLPPPGPGGQSRGGSLSSVACPSASACVADGTYGEYFPSVGETFSRGMVLTDSGGTWTAVQPPLPPTGEAGSAEFNSTMQPVGVACPSAAWCTAVGTYYDDAAGPDQGLLLTWSGGTWTAAQAPAPPGNTGMEPYEVACPAVSSCTVTGFYRNSAGYPRGLVDTGARSA
jgi:Cutinase